MNILCYGDSNTWGYIPDLKGYSKFAIAKKYNDDECWWYKLTENHSVLIDGLCGRCINNENPWLPNRNAMHTIMQDLKKYRNIDIVIIQLGTNDCKNSYDNTPQQITQNLSQLAEIIRNELSAYIIIISPAIIKENNSITQKYYIGAEKKSQELDELYRELADHNDYLFVSGKDLKIGLDGEHLTKIGHQELGNKVNELINKHFIQLIL